ncbi:9450_t:CDS:2 [Entrophospora sp. SA101]|nr:9450_t:CDS:2 [Entrophospora sp. SA101]CAJ0880217.1 15198_t:CDS:2 [Entrophospora sp. SA101]
MPIFARGKELKYFFPVIDNEISIERKITQLMRSEEEGLKNAIRFHSRFFSLIGSEHKKSQEGNKETTMYGKLDQTKLSQSLNDEKKLRELIQKEVIHESARGIAGMVKSDTSFAIAEKQGREY